MTDARQPKRGFLANSLSCVRRPLFCRKASAGMFCKSVGRPVRRCSFAVGVQREMGLGPCPRLAPRSDWFPCPGCFPCARLAPAPKAVSRAQVGSRAQGWAPCPGCFSRPGCFPCPGCFPRPRLGPAPQPAVHFWSAQQAPIRADPRAFIAGFATAPKSALPGTRRIPRGAAPMTSASFVSVVTFGVEILSADYRQVSK